MRRSRRVGAALAGAAAGEALLLWRRTNRLGGRVLVRCRKGHVFATLWIPGASVKSLRLGLWRVQRCPVGRHVSLVTPVRPSELSADEIRAAPRDLPLP